MKVSDLVAAEVRERFSEPDAALVLSKFSASELPTIAPKGAPDRILLGVLKLSDGRLSEVDKWLREACIDWRDLLVASGLAYENWPEVLHESGFRVPAPSPTRRTVLSAPRLRRSRFFWFRLALAVAILSGVLAALLRS